MCQQDRKQNPVNYVCIQLKEEKNVDWCLKCLIYFYILIFVFMGVVCFFPRIIIYPLSTQRNYVIFLCTWRTKGGNRHVNTWHPNTESFQWNDRVLSRSVAREIRSAGKPHWGIQSDIFIFKRRSRWTCLQRNAGVMESINASVSLQFPFSMSRQPTQSIS